MHFFYYLLRFYSQSVMHLSRQMSLYMLWSDTFFDPVRQFKQLFLSIMNQKEIQQAFDKILKEKWARTRLYQLIERHNVDLQRDHFDRIIQVLGKQPAFIMLIKELEELQNKEKKKKLSQEIHDIQQSPSLLQKYSKVLRFKIVKARGFEKFNERNNQFLRLNATFKSKRASSLFPAKPNPDINIAFQFGLQKLGIGTRKDLISTDQKIQLSIYQLGIGLISIKQIQWRYALCIGSSVCFKIEMPQLQGEQRLGILQIELDLLPRELQSNRQGLLQKTIATQRQILRKNLQRFKNYSDQWYTQFKSRQNYDKRNLKIYALTEDAHYRPVTVFVAPLYKVRGLQSPSHVLRFVSLIPFSKIAPGIQDPWRRFHSMLQNRSGSIHDHCNLLCSLLLGLGLNAYVALGKATWGCHSWVMTFEVKGKKQNIKFWQSMYSCCFGLNDQRRRNNYLTIDCLYSYQSFYGNIQKDNFLDSTSFNFQDESLWKAMKAKELSLVPVLSKQLSLLYQKQNQWEIEQDLEEEIRKNIYQHRKKSSRTTKFDNKLQSILSSAVINYQIDKLTGNVQDNQHFKYALKNHISKGYTYQALPIQISNSEDIFKMILKEQLGKRLLELRGDSVQYGVRVSVKRYGEWVSSRWMILGVMYLK